MAGLFPYSYYSKPNNDLNFNGGLNTTSGPLSLKDTESPDLKNCDFNKFGSILKRNGYSNIYPNLNLGTPGIDSHTSLLLHLDNNVTDSENTPKTVTNNNVTFSNSIYEFGGYAGSFDGSTSYLGLSDSSDFQFGTNDFTIDTWMYFPSIPSNKNFPIFYRGATGTYPNNNFRVIWQTNSGGQFLVSSDQLSNVFSFTVSYSFSATTWYHVAVVRSSGVITIYVNGNSIGSNAAAGTTLNSGGANVVQIGATANIGTLPCIIDEYRVSNVARWTSNFTPPISAYSISVGTSYSDGLFWYEYVNAGSYSSSLIDVTGGNIYSMPSASGLYNNITGSVTITPGNFFSSTNWANNIFMTNGYDSPMYWTGSGNVTNIPALQANSYTFTVYSITTPPAVGDTYTNNSVTYTVKYVNTSGSSGAISGTIIMTGSGAPTTYGTLTRATGSGDATISFSLEVLNAAIASAKFITQWNNYLFLANVQLIGGTYLPTRIYWCNVRDFTTWSATSWIEISMQDGQPITGMYPLADRLVIFKERSIYNLFFTGDSTLPFVYLISNSPTVGCMAPYSIQEVENGLVFLSHDGFYYYDSNNAYKMSLQIQNTIAGLNPTKLANARSLKQRNKNRYMCAVTSSTSNTNDTVIVWDWVLNAFSLYSGIAPSAMKTCFVGGNVEQIYFADYSGYTYQMDTGVDDYPLGTQTAISAYYWTNWKAFGDAALQKASPNVTIYYESSNSVMTFGYSYDFQQGIQYQNTFSMSNGTAVYGSAIWDTSKYAGAGGQYIRQDLAGRGRVVAFYFANSNLSETFQIDGIAEFINIQTNA